MPPPPVRRTLLGRSSTLSSQRKVYRARDAVEMEEIEGYDVVRKRVLLDEVLLVTLHRAIGWAFVVAMLVLALLFGLIGLGVAASDRTAGLAVGGATVVPLLALLALRLVLGVEVVTVFGKRTKAEIHFWFRKRRAREVFSLVCRLARERQQARPPLTPGGAPS